MVKMCSHKIKKLAKSRKSQSSHKWNFFCKLGEETQSRLTDPKEEENTKHTTTLFCSSINKAVQPYVVSLDVAKAYRSLHSFFLPTLSQRDARRQKHDRTG